MAPGLELQTLEIFLGLSQCAETKDLNEKQVRVLFIVLVSI